MTESMNTYERTVYLAMPGYGHVTIGAAVGLFMAGNGEVDVRGKRCKLNVWQEYAEGSLLAHVFNGLWCGALNKVHEGGRVDYFAMQHSDIEPERYWLRKLIEEMELQDLDVLGVVAPLKNQDGLTSIALDGGDPWHPLCRLTMGEVFQLPETFTEKDTGHPVLINTGLWVCRFDYEVMRRIHFTIKDRVVFDESENKHLAQVEPEDWFISRRFHEAGLRVGATRKIALNHAGSQRFSNQFPWGEEAFDSRYVPGSVLPAGVVSTERAIEPAVT